REGDDKGRIYRIVPANGKPRKFPNLEKLTATALVQALDSSNEWQRDKAQQLLLWRNDPAAIPTLKKLAVQSTNVLARLHALCALDGRDGLTSDLLEPALKDPNPGLRENAVRLAEKKFTPTALALATDPSEKVRLQLACSLGEWKNAEAG